MAVSPWLRVLYPRHASLPSRGLLPENWHKSGVSPHSAVSDGRPGPAFGRQVIHINESLGLDLVYMNALALTYVSSRVSSKPRLAPPSLETY